MEECLEIDCSITNNSSVMTNHISNCQIRLQRCACFWFKWFNDWPVLVLLIKFVK